MILFVSIEIGRLIVLIFFDKVLLPPTLPGAWVVSVVSTAQFWLRLAVQEVWLEVAR